MIDRYSITASPEKISERFTAEVPVFYKPHYNACPTQLLPVITAAAPQGVSTFYWGTSPEWSKDKALSEKIINVRIESIQERAPLRRNLMKGRCIIPADGFCAWKQTGKKTFIPYRFVKKDQSLFSMAGFWEEYEDTDGNQIQTFAILTVTANELVNPIHARMPVMFDKKSEQQWLNTDASEAELLSLLTAYPPDQMNLYTISPRIDDANLNVPSLIAPTAPADQFGNLTLFD